MYAKDWRFPLEHGLTLAPGTPTVHVQKEEGHYVNNKQEDWQFKLNKILHNTDQETTYDECAEDIVNSVLQGYNGTIMAYGQTGAGKTFTMMGGTQSYKYRGICPRAIAHIFRYIQSNPQVAVAVRVSYLEVYNEQFFDLLRDNARLGDLAVMDDQYGNVTVRGLSMKPATSEEDALNLLFEGETNRAIAEHQMNKTSTRSHCVFTLHLEIRSRVESSEKIARCKLNLVDLAGSERVKNTGSSGKTLREATYINKSLTFLEQVVIALSSKSRDHIPFRQSKLTNVLRDSLGGNCKTRLIANIWAESRHIHETVSTLKFATRMMRVANAAIVNERQDPAMLLKKYERQIRQLKQELAMHDSLSSRTNIQYDDFTPEQQQAVYDEVVSYVEGKVEEIKIVNIKQIQEAFRQFKAYAGNLRSRVALPSKPGTAMGVPADAKGSSGADAKAGGSEAKGNFVGELDGTTSGFHIGGEDAGAPPRKIKPRTDGKDPSSPKSLQASPKAGRAAGGLRSEPTPGEAEAFEDYKKGDGKEDSEAFEANKKEYQAKKAELKSLSNEVNRTKDEIDKIAGELEAMRSASAGGEEDSPDGTPVIDEAEFSLIRKLKSKKRSYQDLFHKRKMAKSESSYLKSLVKQSKLKLCQSFLEWFRSRYQAKAAGASSGELAAVAESDALDDGEQFEKLERERIMEEDPDSLAFFNAKKTMMATLKRRGKRKNKAARE